MVVLLRAVVTAEPVDSTGRVSSANESTLPSDEDEEEEDRCQGILKLCRYTIIIPPYHICELR